MALFIKVSNHYKGKCGNCYPLQKDALPANRAGGWGVSVSQSSSPNGSDATCTRSSKVYCLVGSSDAQETGQPGLCSLIIHFMDPQKLCAEYGEDFKMSPQWQVEDAIAPPSLLQVTVLVLQGCRSFLEGVIDSSFLQI